MRSAPRFSFLFLCLPFVLGLTAASYAQTNDPEAVAAIARSQPAFTAQTPSDVTLAQPGQMTVSSSTIFDFATGGVVGASAGTINTNAGRHDDGNDDDLVNGNVRHTPKGGNIDGLDTVATFGGSFAAQAGPSQGHGLSVACHDWRFQWVLLTIGANGVGGSNRWIQGGR